MSSVSSTKSAKIFGIIKFQTPEIAFLVVRVIHSAPVISSYADSTYMENDLPKCCRAKSTFGWKQSLLLCVVENSTQ